MHAPGVARDRPTCAPPAPPTPGAPDGYGPTSLTEPQLDELLAAVEAHMGERGADVTVVRRRKVGAPGRAGARMVPPAAPSRPYFLARRVLNHPPTHLPACLPSLPPPGHHHHPQVAAPSVGAPDMSVADVCIRRRVGSAPPLEVRVAVVGNVDSGKSTMVGVLTRSVLDDGRGFARSKVFRHGHEVDTGEPQGAGAGPWRRRGLAGNVLVHGGRGARLGCSVLGVECGERLLGRAAAPAGPRLLRLRPCLHSGWPPAHTPPHACHAPPRPPHSCTALPTTTTTTTAGRTSSIGQHNLCLDSRGGILNDAAFRTQSIADYVARASKVVTLVDLAGHEKVGVVGGVGGGGGRAAWSWLPACHKPAAA